MKAYQLNLELLGKALGHSGEQLPEIRVVVNALLSALEHMQAALDVLDESGAPPELGARLDMAICRTREVLQQIELQADSDERAMAK